ncbi:hypothetical protein Q4Q39_18650 [Flavivirga amylovorans]|uniref:DUF4398 domain-containing protein n=1 Tax=Flavivirga amylovorans TaxID=870486 RepID=A0ABT8X6B2_9FLAO|nr:hypothetical protein [Flavivirga amylovorans]MDO5989429.1 hypothetical protein [Flavivirga amylovorans]
MKNYYFILFLITSLSVSGQGNCDYANSYLVSAYSHVKDSYDSNNINHLQYYANRSLESFKLAKKEFTDCNCQAALDLTDKCIELLAKVDTAETFENGRFFVKRARDYGKNSVIEIDKCSAAAPTNEVSEDLTVAQGQDDDLTDLQNEQLRLKQQQEALKLKEQQIKMKLAEQKEKELEIKKKKIILTYESAITSNINIYNETLNICGCINYKPFRDNKSLEDMSEKSIDDVKTHYMTRIKSMASEYVSLINDCEE